jgi:hypothetical protein
MLPPEFPIGLPVVAVPVGLNFFFNNGQKFGPLFPALLLSSLSEVNHIPMMRMTRTTVNLIASNIWKNHFSGTAISINGLIHYFDRRRNSDCLSVRCSGIIKSEAHSEHNTTLKALASIFSKGFWIFMTSIGKKKRCDV